MSKSILLLSAAALLSLTACGQPEHLSADFGNATNHNNSLQIVNPEPTYLAPDNPDLDGVRGNLAIDRYKTGTVIQPEAEETSDF